MSRKAAAGLVEVRGIFAPLDQHAAIIAAAAEITSKPAKPPEKK